MMNKAVTDAIVHYKTVVSNNLRDQQSSLTPCLDPFIYECQVYEYKYDAHRTLVNPTKEACFRMHYMYLKPMSPRKYMEYIVSRRPISEMVAENVIFPFLFFINKKMIPWSMIDIIFTHENYFVLCHTTNEKWLSEFRNVKSVDILHLPDGCRYCVKGPDDPYYNPYKDPTSDEYRPITDPNSDQYRPEADPDSPFYRIELDPYSPFYRPECDFYRDDYRYWKDPLNPNYDARRDPNSSEYIPKFDPDNPEYDPDFDPDATEEGGGDESGEGESTDSSEEIQLASYRMSRKATSRAYEDPVEGESPEEPAKPDPFLPELPNQVDKKYFGEVIMSFNNDGTYNDDDKHAAISIVNCMTHMDFNSYSTNSRVNAFAVSENTSIKFFPNNVLLFRNNLLDTSSKIEFKSTLISINEGANPDNDQLNFIVFRDKETFPTVDNISKANLRYIRPYVQYLNGDIAIPDEMRKLFNNEFSFEMDYKKNYATNRAESIQYIIGYNAALFEEAYLKNYRNLFVEPHNGAWVLSNLNEFNELLIPCRHGNFNQERIIMLVNGMLYKFSHMTKYTNKSHCLIPIKDIEPTDKIELFRFTDINNSVFNILVNENDPYIEYDEEYLNNDIVIFSTIPPTDDYSYPEEGLQHFPVEYAIERDPNDDKKMKIIFFDKKYYGEKLKLAYKHRFIHKWYTITADQSEQETYHIDLDDDFMYCYDYSKYLVFYNGRRLSTDQYRLCLPVRSTTPFSRFEIFLTSLVKEGDRLDIIYTSSLMKDVVLKDSIDEDGVIEVDKSDITYSLSKDSYMVWANGKKIPSESIVNIDSTHIKIVEDIGSTKTVCVTKFLYDIDELTEVFKSTDSIWDTITAGLTDDQIKAILNFSSTDLTNSEEWIYDGNVSVKAIMYELIREKFIMDAKVDTSGGFAYGYDDVDDTIITTKDSGDNNVLEVGDANIRGNIDGVERQWP